VLIPGDPNFTYLSWWCDFDQKISDGNFFGTLPLFAELEYLCEQVGDPDDVVIGSYLYFYQDVVRFR